MDTQTELKRIEEQEQVLADRRRKLEEKLQHERMLEEKLEQMFSTSGYASPRDLVLALINKFNVRIGALKRADVKPAGTSGRRTRTKVTPELRDDVKAQLNEKTISQISKETGISYMTLAKIRDGFYD